MRRIAIAVGLVFGGVLAACGDDAPPAGRHPTEPEMKFLLAEAASVPAEPLIDLARRGANLGPDPEEDISFTPLLWMAFLGPGHHIQDLGVSDDAPILLRLVDALAGDSVRMKGDRLSVLHPELVTAVGMQPGGDAVTGVVHFRVPGALTGYAEFTASRSTGKWLVTEFRLPKDGLTTTRRADGTWLAQSK